MSYSFTDKFIEILYIVIPVGIILGTIILYEKSAQKKEDDDT